MRKFLNIFTGITILIGVFYIFYAYVLVRHEWRYVTPTDNEVQRYKISKTAALELYQLMKDTHEILAKHQITYWAVGGTLLGAVRNKGIIPYDDDLDIGILHHDEIKLQDAIMDFKKLGYHISYNKLYCICGKKGCLDIFIFYRHINKFILANFLIKDLFPNEIFYEDELFPLKKYQFGEIEIMGPQNAQSALDRQLPEWDKYAIIHQPHNWHITLSEIEKKTKFILTPELLKPAYPTGPLKNRTKELYQISF